MTDGVKGSIFTLGYPGLPEFVLEYHGHISGASLSRPYP